MEIRSAQKEELPDILKMNEDSVPHVSSVGLADMRYFLKEAQDFWVIEEEGELAGFMIVLRKGLDYTSLNYEFFCANYEQFDYVDRIVIGKKFRGKRMGTALYEHLFGQSDQGRVTCEVNLEPPNPESLAFHEFLGFTQVAEQKTEGGKKRVALMVKSL